MNMDSEMRVKYKLLKPVLLGKKDTGNVRIKYEEEK